MNGNIKKLFANNKGLTTIEIIAYMAVAAIIASIAIVQYNDAFAIRSERVIKNFESIDTIIGE